MDGTCNTNSGAVCPDSSSSREGSSSNVTSSQYNEGHKDHRQSKNRDPTREWNRKRPYPTTTEENLREEGDKKLREELHQQTFPESSQSQAQSVSLQKNSTVFPTYNYNPADRNFADNNRRALPMMSPYNLFPAMNPQWGFNPMDMSLNSSANLPVAPGMDPSSSSAMNPYAFMGMGGDCNMYGMMGNYCQSGVVMPAKEIITLSKCVLYPPNPKAPPPTVRIKPLGCRTVFVGGLPAKITDDIVQEVFERCGEITTIRMSTKNFCHIRFTQEPTVERAIFFSGYKMKIDNKDDVTMCGIMHVDYAFARDDQSDYESRQELAQREARQMGFRIPTPPPAVHYSEHEADILGERLRGEETFQGAVSLLITWLERGECHKRNAGSFYSMIQSTNSHTRRLMNEKLKYEDELNKAKVMLQKQMQGILLQFNDIGKVFAAASVQKVWDHFTKAQRRNIELWKKQTEEIRSAHVEEVLNDRIEDEMELSDGESSTKDSQDNNQKDSLQEEISLLKEECDSLRCQLEASENEMTILRSETDPEKDFKEQQIQALKQALQGFQKEILSLNQKNAKDESELKELRALQSTLDAARKDELKNTEKNSSHNDYQRDSLNLVTSSSALNITENEASLIGLISTFLNVHPFGASIDYICSYLLQIDSYVRDRDVESLMRRFSTVFKEVSTGIGASLEKKWTFSGFK